MKALFTLLDSDAAQVDVLSVEQILALCGNGKLLDGSECSQDFRAYLQIAKSANLVKYVQSCITGPFEKNGNALQDI